MTLKCQICEEPVNANRLEDCRYVALGEPCCSFEHHRDAYALDRYDRTQYELPLHLEPG